MNDLTILHLTVNKVPDAWAEYHKSILLEAIGDSPLIIISKKPMDWGGLNLIQEEEPSVNNIYKQILRGAKLATTPYIAIAEDDTLYHKSHFSFRPPMDTYAFDGHRWGIFTWGKPVFYWKDRVSNAAMIASRELVVSALEERFAKYPNSQIGELGKEKGTNINRQKSMNFWPEVGMVFFSHVNSLDPTEQHKSKRPGAVQAYEIPYWGRAENLVKSWK
jgi:hypothetical protein